MLGWASLCEVWGWTRWTVDDGMGWGGMSWDAGEDWMVGGSCPGGKGAHRCGHEDEHSVT